MAYDLSIGPDKVILNGTAISQSDLLRRVNSDVKQFGFSIPVTIIVAPSISYGHMVSALCPIWVSSLSDYAISVPQRKPIEITGWTCPMAFAASREETITVDGTNIHTSAGTTTLGQLYGDLSRLKSTNEHFRVFIHSSRTTSAEEFYNAISVAHDVAPGSILWDIKNLRPEPTGGGDGILLPRDK